MNPRAGITLVELLAGLVIAALIATILSSSLAQLFDRTGRLERAREGVEIDLAAASAFRRVVERAVLLPAPGPAEPGAPSFQLTGEALYWIAAEPGYPGSAGLYVYGLEIVSAEAGWSIVLLRAPLPADYPGGSALGDVLADSAPAPIWTGSARPGFMAFDPAGAGWTAQWDAPAPPRLVALALPGFPLAAARLPHGAPAAPGAAAAPDPGTEDQPGLGHIERGAEGTP